MVTGNTGKMVADMKIAILFFTDQYMKIYQLLAKQNEVFLVDEIPELWNERSDDSHLAYISVEELIYFYKRGNIGKVVILPVMTKTLNHFVDKIIDRRVSENDILYFPLEQSRKTYTAVSQLYDSMCLFKERQELDYLGLHVHDGCNFRCKHCSMLEGAAISYRHISLEKTESALKRLKELFAEIGVIQLVGGEPLLSDQIIQYMDIVRTCYPYSEVQILTKGSLVFNQKDAFFEKLQEHGISLMISHYPQLDDDIEQLNAFLKSKKVEYYFTEKINEFVKYYDFEKYSDIDSSFETCQAMQYCKNGLNLREDIIAPCCVPFALEHMVERFGMDISFCTTSRLDEQLTAQEITRLLAAPHEMCKVCHLDGFTEWRQVDCKEKLDYKNWSI